MARGTLVRTATLEDVRAEALTPDRLNAMVFGGFAIVALTIAVVGVAGVLAFSVSARTREFGIRLEGTRTTALGIGTGLACGLALQRLAGSYFDQVQTPGAAGVLLAAALVASVWPAIRAARVISSPARGVVQCRQACSFTFYNGPPVESDRDPWLP